MTSSSGDFELEVSKKGIYYRPEQRWLSPSFLWEFTDTNCRLPTSTGTGYSVKVTKVDVGCKKTHWFLNGKKFTVIIDHCNENMLDELHIMLFTSFYEECLDKGESWFPVAPISLISDFF